MYHLKDASELYTAGTLDESAVRGALFQTSAAPSKPSEPTSTAATIAAASAAVAPIAADGGSTLPSNAPVVCVLQSCDRCKRDVPDSEFLMCDDCDQE